MNEDKIIQKLETIDGKTDQVFARVLAIEERLEKVETTMATKNDIRSVMNVLDQQGVILQRLDQERIFTIERVKRIEDDVEKIKLQLKLA